MKGSLWRGDKNEKDSAKQNSEFVHSSYNLLTAILCCANVILNLYWIP